MFADAQGWNKKYDVPLFLYSQIYLLVPLVSIVVSIVSNNNVGTHAFAGVPRKSCKSVKKSRIRELENFLYPYFLYY